MKPITVTNQDSHADIREKLKTFGFLSAVEASIDSTKPNTIHLREVGLGERLMNFVSRIKGGTEENKSRDALLKLAEINPAVGKLLGQSLFEKTTWTASDLRQGLKIQAQKLTSDTQSLKHVGNTEKLGVANVMIDRIKADTEISWSLASGLPPSDKQDFSSVKRGERNIVGVLVRIDSETEYEKKAYRTALENGQGHIVIKPINPTNESIDCLLEVIAELDKNKTGNDNRRITIAAGGDAGLAEKVWARKAAYDHKLAQKSAWAGHKVGMPAALFALQSDKEMIVEPASIDIAGKTKSTNIPGLSFYCGSPVKLEAEVAIVMQSDIVERANELRSEGKPRLHDVCQAAFYSPGLVAEETTDIMNVTSQFWGFQAVGLPAADLPAQRLISIGFLNDTISSVDAEEFFRVHLQEVSGRVVIQLTANPIIDRAAWNVAKALQEANPDTEREIIFASPIQAVIDRMPSAQSTSKTSTTSTTSAASTASTATVKPASIFNPKGNKQAPADPGIHFLKNSAYSLHADRVLVPASDARTNAYPYVTENQSRLQEATPGVTLLVGMQYTAMGSPALTGPGKIKQRYLDLLNAADGRVVISPVDNDDEVLLEMMEAISEACETNPKLSVSIATEDKTLQAELANAYQQFGINKIEAGENAGLDDEDEEPPMATWEKI